VREFEGYVVEAESSTAEESENIIENDIDEDEDDEKYSSDEVAIVKHHIKSLKLVIEIMKFSLQVMTLICDSVYSESVPLTDNLSQLSISCSSQSADQTDPSFTVLAESKLETNTCERPLYSTNSLRKQLMVCTKAGVNIFVSELVKHRIKLLSAVTDLGCELYPPVEERDIQILNNNMNHYIREILSVLALPQYQNRLLDNMREKLMKFITEFL
jgi:hypothetical protein